MKREKTELATAGFTLVVRVKEGIFVQADSLPSEAPGKPTQGREDVYLETGLCRKAAES